MIPGSAGNAIAVGCVFAKGIRAAVGLPTSISTDSGVESTARQGTGLGLAFVIVEDACGAFDPQLTSSRIG